MTRPAAGDRLRTRSARSERGRDVCRCIVAQVDEKKAKKKQAITKDRGGRNEDEYALSLRGLCRKGGEEERELV